MNMLAWPHGPITEVLPNIFFVTGTNITNYNNIELQHSRNMVIVRDNNKLTLINTVRLDDSGLIKLDNLGKVENVVRIGAFHGRDDAFYLERYQAKLWALPEMVHDNAKITDVELTAKNPMPFSNGSLFVFETSVFPEGILHIDREGGILVTCDSIKNWLAADEFFSQATAKLYEAQGFFGTASISSIWKQATKVQSSDLVRLKSLKFKHLLSAHGAPLLNSAYEQVSKSIKQEFNV